MSRPSVAGIVAGVVVALLLVTSDAFAGLAFLALAALALVAWTPRLGPTVLRRIRWAQVPYLGRTTGLAASLVLAALAIGSVIVAPAARNPSPRPAATANVAGATGRSTQTTTVAFGASPSAAPASQRASPASAASPGPGACVNQDPSANVYHPDRLVPIEACVTVTGVVVFVRREDDGDWHINVRLDPGQERLLNDKNRSEQGGALVVEIICANRVTQASAVDACRDYTNAITAPPTGAHVTLTGPFVLDTAHGWNEVHPVWALRVDEAAAATPTANAAPPSPTPTAAPQTTALTETAVPTAAPSAIVSQPPAPPTPITFVVSITASRYGFVSATTTPGGSCTAQARLPSGNLSTAQGLEPTVIANASGVVSWTYRTVSSTTPGTGTHTVTCTYAGATRSSSAA